MNSPINKITQHDIDLLARERSLSAYQFGAIKSAFYPGRGTGLGLVYCGLKLNGEAGEFAEHVGKAMRDDSFLETDLVVTGIGSWEETKDLTEERRSLLIKELGDVLWYVSAAAQELGVDLFEVAITNLMKLKDRTDRDALQGSGDER